MADVILKSTERREPAALRDRAVRPAQLRWVCDPAELPFETTEELKPLAQEIGQDRAVSALAFGLEMESPGFNLFVAGTPGTARMAASRRNVERIAADRPPPGDWCYVYNFEDPDRPWAI